MKGCETGCSNLTGGEIHHHKDCQFYKGSLSEELDMLREQAKRRNVILSESDELFVTSFLEWVSITYWNVFVSANSRWVTRAFNISDRVRPYLTAKDLYIAFKEKIKAEGGERLLNNF